MQINTTSDALDNLNKKLGGADIEIEPSTNKVDALKKIYKTLGGTDDVKGLSTVYQVLEKITEVAGGGGGSLPSVTSADEGKVLAVNESGEWAANMPNDFIVRVDTNEGVFVSATTIYMADADYLKNKIDNNIPIIGYAYNVDADSPDFTTLYSSVIQGNKEIDGEDIFYDIVLYSTLDFEHKLRFGYSLNTSEWWSD